LQFPAASAAAQNERKKNMTGPIVAGANFFRSTVILAVADIQSLDGAAALELVPGVPGRAINPIAMILQFNYGGTEWTLSGSPTAFAFWGNSNTGIKINASELIAALIGSKTASQTYNVHPPFQATAVEPLADLEGLGIYLIETAAGFDVAGSGTVEITTFYALI
jgi:hypothetical protein